MLTDRQMFSLFSEALVDEPADPTFLDELFEVLVEEVRTTGLGTVAPRPLGTFVRRRPPWRRTPAWAGLVAAGFVVAIGIALLYRPSQVGPPPTPSPSTSPSFPALTGSFTSPIGGYSVNYPEGAEVIAATEVAAPGLHAWNPDQPWVDSILDQSGFGQWNIVSAPLPAAMTSEQWLADQLAAALLSGSGFPACGATMTTEPITIDGVAGIIDTHCSTNDLGAIVISGERAYVFDLAADDPSMSWFRAMLATVRLDPSAAAPYVSPAPTIQTTPAAS